MAITFYIPGPLREHTGGLHKVLLDCSGSTVGEALATLWTAYPGLRDRVLAEQGDVRQHVNVFVGEENIRYCGGLGAPVTSGSSITLIPAVSGGTLPSTKRELVEARRLIRNLTKRRS
jgi:molybdopterin converting factor small subunit